MDTDHCDYCYSSNYEECRLKFRSLCKLRSFEIETLPIENEVGQKLFIDVGYKTATTKPSNVLLHISGTHGVEGYSGSAIQINFLYHFDEIMKNIPNQNSLTIILVHTLNPFGMKYGRRFNENNVDLNRNYIFDQEELNGLKSNPSPLYLHLNKWLNPEIPMETCKESFADKANMFWKSIVHNRDELKQAVVGGQYTNKKGIFLVVILFSLAILD